MARRQEPQWASDPDAGKGPQRRCTDGSRERKADAWPGAWFPGAVTTRPLLHFMEVGMWCTVGRPQSPPVMVTLWGSQQMFLEHGWAGLIPCELRFTLSSLVIWALLSVDRQLGSERMLLAQGYTAQVLETEPGLCLLSFLLAVHLEGAQPPSPGLRVALTGKAQSHSWPEGPADGQGRARLTCAPAGASALSFGPDGACSGRTRSPAGRGERWVCRTSLSFTGDLTVIYWADSEPLLCPGSLPGRSAPPLPAPPPCLRDCELTWGPSPVLPPGAFCVFTAQGVIPTPQ